MELSVKVLQADLLSDWNDGEGEGKGDFIISIRCKHHKRFSLSSKKMELVAIEFELIIDLHRLCFIPCRFLLEHWSGKDKF